ncbi:MAG: hypothetical protein NVSMB52_19600 [Chloroflexota bacterium]
MEILSDPLMAGLIGGAIKFIFVAGLIIGILIVVGVIALVRR